MTLEQMHILRDIPYSVQLRLHLIDFLLQHFSSVKRKHIMSYFSVGEATVTRDFRLYQKINQEVIYSPVSRCYVPTSNFVSVFNKNT